MVDSLIKPTKASLKNAFFAGLLLAISITLIDQLPQSGLVFPQLINSGHALVFFFATLFLLKACHQNNTSSPYLLLIASIALFIGTGIEIVQPYIGRDRSLLDLTYDLLGILFACFIHRYAGRVRPRTVLFACLFFVAAGLGFPAYRSILFWQINQTPVLLNFERQWETNSLSASKATQLKVIPAFAPFEEQGYVGEITFNTDEAYPGIGLEHPKNDWREFQTLSWEVVSLEQENFTLNLRVHDAQHNQEYNDRFNGRFVIQPGLNHIELPLREIIMGPSSRSLDLSQISNLKFFVGHPEKPITLFLDNVRLN